MLKTNPQGGWGFRAVGRAHLEVIEPLKTSSDTLGPHAFNPKKRGDHGCVQLRQGLQIVKLVQPSKYKWWTRFSIVYTISIS